MKWHFERNKSIECFVEIRTICMRDKKNAKNSLNAE